MKSAFKHREACTLLSAWLFLGSSVLRDWLPGRAGIWIMMPVITCAEIETHWDHIWETKHKLLCNSTAEWRSDDTIRDSCCIAQAYQKAITTPMGARPNHRPFWWLRLPDDEVVVL